MNRTLVKVVIEGGEPPECAICTGKIGDVPAYKLTVNRTIYYLHENCTEVALHTAVLDAIHKRRR